MTPAEQALADAFSRFAGAVKAADAPAYRALAVADAPPQEALFLENAARVKQRGWSMRLVELTIEGEVGVARFELIDAHGARADQGEVTFTLEASGWKVRSL